MKAEYITHVLVHAVGLERHEKKIAEKVYNFLDRDLVSVVAQDGVFWFEVNHYASLPNYVYDYTKRLMKRLGYRYINN